MKSVLSKSISKLKGTKNWKNDPKIFCIGVNKTGTTSLEMALKDLGFKLGHQNKALDLLEAYKRRQFNDIIEFCRSADAFQDAPFSYFYTFMALDQCYTNAKFILTIRDSDEAWYNSLLSFHSKLFGNGEKPTAEQLKNAKRNPKRSVYDNMKMRFNLPDSDMYNKDILVDYYNTHNKIVMDYFRFKENLLVLNIKEEDAYNKFCTFINVKPIYDNFPWENKTSQK